MSLPRRSFMQWLTILGLGGPQVAQEILKASPPEVDAICPDPMMTSGYMSAALSSSFKQGYFVRVSKGLVEDNAFAHLSGIPLKKATLQQGYGLGRTTPWPRLPR